MGHKSNNKCPHKRKEEGHLTQKRRKEEWATQKDGGRDWNYCCHKPRSGANQLCSRVTGWISDKWLQTRLVVEVCTQAKKEKALIFVKSQKSFTKSCTDMPVAIATRTASNSRLPDGHFSESSCFPTIGSALKMFFWLRQK